MTNWLSLNRPRSQARLRLFCFPYAGGGATLFYGWPDHLPVAVEVCPVQLPGRGSRLGEQPFTELTKLVKSLVNELSPLLDKPFALFGHSMGGLLCFELARALRKRSGLQPTQMFIGGCRAPHLPDPDPPAANLPDSDLVAELERLDGTPRELLEQREVLQYMLPILRADFNVCETYRYQSESPLSCPITAFGGLEDAKATRTMIEPWQEVTTGRFVLRMFPGGHFFLHTAERILLQMLSKDLNKIIEQ